VVAARIELSTGATLVEDVDELSAMPFEQRDRRLCFW
jgi:hypothetical protein